MKITEQVFGKLTARVSTPNESPKKALVLLHGVGSNEVNLLEFGKLVGGDRLVISLRAPIAMGPQSFAWFHVQFTAQGPVHNWGEANQAFALIEGSLDDISAKTGIAAQDIAIFGFSQGAIMTIGLALNSTFTFEKYFAASGRTLPEFAKLGQENRTIDFAKRKVFVLHGSNDSKLPFTMARSTERILGSLNVNLIFREYPADHEIPSQEVEDVRQWLSQA